MNAQEYAFYEVQYFSWWVYLIIAMGVALILWLMWRGMLSLKLGLGVGIGLLVVVLMTLRVTTFIKEQSLTVYLGWLPVITKTIPLSDIKAARICAYRPLVEFGGWGWRYNSEGTHALTAQGTQGICLHLQDGQKVLVGSSKGQEFVEAIQANYTQSRRPFRRPLKSASSNSTSPESLLAMPSNSATGNTAVRNFW